MSATKQGGFKAVAAASIGNALEWYDFSIFAFFATYISRNFFIDGDAHNALINTLIVFGSGFLARPVGAVLIGVYGDKMGRKAAITLTIAIMALGTFIILVTPPASYIGIYAPILLLLARLLQGLSAGGEIGGATAFLLEHAPKNKRLLYASFLQASMGFSNILAAMMGVLVTTFFTESEVLEYAWRFAFLFGLLIVPVGFYIRSTLDETPEFKDMQKNRSEHHSPLKEIFSKHLFRVVVGILFSILWTSCIYTFIIYMPSAYYADVHVGLMFTRNDVFWASLIGNIFMTIGCVFFAQVAQKVGAFRLLFVGIVLLGLAPFVVLNWLFVSKDFVSLVMGHTFFCILISIFAGLAPSVLANYYPAEIRSTALAISYNTAAIFFAGFTPALMAYLVKYNALSPAYWVLFACVVGLIGTYFISKDKRKLDEKDIG